MDSYPHSEQISVQLLNEGNAVLLATRNQIDIRLRGKTEHSRLSHLGFHSVLNRFRNNLFGEA